MRRLKKSLCGYILYKCIGINILPAPKPICCDSNVYADIEITSDSPNRENDNNFYNLPMRFLGIVQQTQYIDLGLIKPGKKSCSFKYAPFLSDGLNDLFSPVGQDSNYIEKTGTDFTALLACYGNSNSYILTAKEPVGFLLPAPLLNDFYPPLLLAIPTVALAAPVTASGTVVNLSIKSACSGFLITAEKTGAQELYVHIGAGQAIVQALEGTGLPITVDVPSNSWTIQGSDYDKDCVKYLLAWLIVGYDFELLEWVGVSDFKGKDCYLFDDDTPKNWVKMLQLGTIRVLNRNVQVVQQTCSPVDVRDWVSLAEIPEDSLDTSLYVFSYVPGSTIKSWIPVKDC